jgi:hypothetical protein
MAAEALPAPTTTQRPRGFGGKCRTTAGPAAALATPASNMRRKTSRAVLSVQRFLQASFMAQLMRFLHQWL